MSEYRDSYEYDRDGHDRRRGGGFFERNCDEAWEQICETFSHPGRLLLRVLLLALLVGVVAGGSYLLKIRAPQLPNKDGSGKDTGASQVEEIDYGEGVRPRVDGERKSKDFYTVLVLGRDTGGGGNTDTMLLASYDVTNQKATVMSIPRDTMVNVAWDIKRINSVYNYYGAGEKGTKALYKEIAQLVGFEPDYQVIVEWDAVGEIVEAMGGIYYDVPMDMNYDDPYQDLHIHQTAGYRKLSGEDVMEVLRYRKDNPDPVTGKVRGYDEGDLGRIKTQQTLLKAMIEQLLQLKNVTKIGAFASAVKKNVTSDLTFEEMLWFGKQAVFGGLAIDNVNFVTMPNTALYAYSRSYRNAQSYVLPNAQELLDLVNNELSPFVEKFTMSDLDIMSINSDGSLSSSTGHVEDSKAAATPPVNVNRYTGDITAWPGSGTSSSETSGGEADGGTTDGTETSDPAVPVEPDTEDGTVTPDGGTTGTETGGTGTTDNTGTTGTEEIPGWLRPQEDTP